ncbi:hypothetical protein OG897_36585 [Streptomyces sp. NBC_00237]|uniref:hypothetical protein n=1 Tax=Streptomyces sp. NBC_00237 TaxID=2975687 RepID=UPI0022538062|nr:hypothetical protein [Streptomyces sp. NBC_00237]MCX5206906.1 hypothetical protein [Streptomyces sp. NBC_00237]
MNNPPSRVRGTLKLTPPTTPTAPRARTAGPGESAIRAALGDDGYTLLRTRRHQVPQTPVTLLADLLWITTREADRLHEQLQNAARQARDRLTRALDGGPASVHGVLNTSGPHTDLLAARTAQQLRQLGAVLDTYRQATATEPRP